MHRPYVARARGPSRQTTKCTMEPVPAPQICPPHPRAGRPRPDGAGRPGAGIRGPRRRGAAGDPRRDGRRARAGRPGGPAPGPVKVEGSDGSLVWGPVSCWPTPSSARSAASTCRPPTSPSRYAGPRDRAGRRPPDRPRPRRASGAGRARRAPGARRPRHPARVCRPSGWSGRRSQPPTCSTTRRSSPSRSPPAATPRPTMPSAQRVVAAYATGDVLGVTGEGDLPDEVAGCRRLRPAARPTSRGWSSSSPASPAAASPRIARALHDVILERGERTVTSLDGDVVRRNLSAGLTFSKEDRETNIRRIGWVAAEISRHGGIAICSPIAPFDATRQQVRAMVDEAGRRLLPRPRRHPAGGVRATRPQGPLREGPAWRDPRVHRHLLAVRGAGRRRRPRRHHRPDASRTPWPTY